MSLPQKKEFRIPQWLMLLIVILAISVITAIINPRFLRINNIMNIFVNEAWIKLQLHVKHFER